MTRVLFWDVGCVRWVIYLPNFQPRMLHTLDIYKYSHQLKRMRQASAPLTPLFIRDGQFRVALFCFFIVFLALLSHHIFLSCPIDHKKALLQFKSVSIGNFMKHNSFNTSSLVSIHGIRVLIVVLGRESPLIQLTLRPTTSLHLQAYIPLPYIAASMSLSPLFHVKTLTFLNVPLNSLQGEILEDGLANLVNLIHLDISYNGLNSFIRSQIFELKNLRDLDLGSNSLTGSIPANIGRLERLQYLSLWLNKFHGEIPASIVQLLELQVLDFGINSLSSAIRDQISMLLNLSTLSLGGNNLSRVIPESIMRMASLKILDLGPNSLLGIIQPSLFDLERLEELLFRGNKLSWNNIVNISPKSLLLTLSLRSYGMVSGIPSWLSVQKYIAFLDLSKNWLEGGISHWLADSKLVEFYLIR